MWDLVDTEYLWKDKCYFNILGVSLFCVNDDEIKDVFDKYKDDSIRLSADIEYNQWYHQNKSIFYYI